MYKVIYSFLSSCHSSASPRPRRTSFMRSLRAPEVATSPCWPVMDRTPRRSTRTNGVTQGNTKTPATPPATPSRKKGATPQSTPRRTKVHHFEHDDHVVSKSPTRNEDRELRCLRRDLAREKQLLTVQLSRLHRLQTNKRRKLHDDPAPDESHGLYFLFPPSRFPAAKLHVGCSVESKSHKFMDISFSAF